MKTICIDGLNLALSGGTGIATYGRNLLSGAREIGFGTQVIYGPRMRRQADPVLNEIALADAPASSQQPFRRKEQIARRIGAIRSQFGRMAKPITPSPEVIWPERTGGRPQADLFWSAQNLFRDAGRCFRDHGRGTAVRFQTDAAPAPSIMHWTSPLALHAHGVPNIYTIHDLIPLRLPHTTGQDKAVFMRLCREVARRADHIAVVSETTRQDVIRLLGVGEDRVTNTYQSVHLPHALTSKLDGEVASELEAIFGLGWKGYFLHFGAIEPKKNLGRIVEAYLAANTATPLIIVGGRGWLRENETALLDQVKRDGGQASERIRLYDYTSFSLLISLVRGARAVIFPSLYEGFGLPVLEAMLLSTAVLTSTGGALPEVAGDAALVVDPYDVSALTRGIRALDDDDDLRADLVRRGLSRAEAFSEAHYQARLRSLYDQVG